MKDQNTFQIPKLHKQKIVVTTSGSAINVINCTFLKSNQRITAVVYCQQLDEIHIQLNKLRRALVNRRGQILFHDNVLPHGARMFAKEWRMQLDITSLSFQRTRCNSQFFGRLKAIGK